MTTYEVIYKNSNPPTRKDELTEEVLYKYACRNFKGFAGIIYHLFIEKEEQFDLLLSSGGSGLAMLGLTKLILHELDKAIPTSLSLPVRRYKDEKTVWSEDPKDFYDNSALIETVRDELKEADQIQNILYVDDDITQVGFVSKTTVSLLLHAKNLDPAKTSVTFVAEDHGFNWKEEDPKLNQVNFYRFSKKIPDTWQIIMNIVPPDILRPIREQFTDDEFRLKSILCVLLGVAVRKTYMATEFTSDLQSLVENKISNFKDLQNQFSDHVQKLIRDGIEEYKSGRLAINPL